MAHDEERARPRVEQVLDGGEHVGVEVVRRLVEDEHVGLVEQDEQQLQATLLAAREVLDGSGELGAREAEALEQLPWRELLAAGDVAGALAADDGRDAFVLHVLQLVELLRQARDAHCGLPRLTVPLVGLTVPVTRPSSVDLPAPLTPRTPVRSPGAMRHSMSLRMVRPS